MMKKNILLIFLLSNFFIGKAQLSVADCKTIAAKWLGLQEHTILGTAEIHQSVRLVQFYNGWVLLCTDTSAAPIGAYSYSGFYYDPEIIQEFYEFLPTRAPYNDNSTHVILSSQFARTSPHSQPLISSAWGQLSPYNDLCPLDSEGVRAPTGCVATAVGQIMNYWQYPQQGYGTKTYIPVTAPMYGYSSLTADYGATTYNWDSMSDQDLALLNLHIGIGVNMDYTPVGSASDILDAKQTLIGNYKYSIDMEYIYGENYTSEQWNTIMQQEIDKLQPVVYSVPGHAAVVDGYDEHDMFHINWGWDGFNNGYYAINHEYSTLLYNIVPAQTIERNYKVEALIYAQVELEDSLKLSDFTPQDDMMLIVSFKNISYKLSYQKMEFMLFLDSALYFVDAAPDVFTRYNEYVQFLRLKLFKLPEGIHSIHILLDPRSRLPDLVNADTVFTYTFEVWNPQPNPQIVFVEPDSSALSVSVAKNSSTPIYEAALGDTLYAHVHIKNAGTKPITAESVIHIIINDTLLIPIPCPALQSLADTTLVVAYSPPKIGLYTIKAIIDPEQAINIITDPLEKSAPPIRVIDNTLPNIAFALLPDGTMYEFSDCTHEDSLRCRFIIQNSSDYDIEQPFFIRIEDNANTQYSYIRINSLPAWATQHVACTFMPYTDTLQATIELNFTKSVAESRLYDNSMKIIYSCPLSSTNRFAPPVLSAYELCVSDTLTASIAHTANMESVEWHTNNEHALSFIAIDDFTCNIVAHTEYFGEVYVWFTAFADGKRMESMKTKLWIHHSAIATTIPRDTTLCNGNVWEISLPDMLEYKWNDESKSNIKYISDAGLYTVELHEIVHCSSPATIEFTVHTSTIEQPHIEQPDTYNLLFYAQDYSTFMWYKNNEPQPNLHEQFEVIYTGDYFIEISNENNCKAYSDTLFITAKNQQNTSTHTHSSTENAYNCFKIIGNNVYNYSLAPLQITSILGTYLHTEAQIYLSVGVYIVTSECGTAKIIVK